MESSLTPEPIVPTAALRPSNEKMGALLSAGIILTAANFISSVGHFLYQLYIGRVLSLGEFGAFNTTLSLVMMLVVPLQAISQAITHYLARHQATDNHEQLLNLQAACQQLLRKWTVILCLVSAALIFPLTRFFHFPRVSLMFVALACVPITMWSMLGTVWCTGLSRFYLLAALNFGTMLVRFLSGAVLVHFYPWAEAGAAATFVSGWILAGVVIFGPKLDSHSVTVSPWDKEFMLYLLAALAVGLGGYIFGFGDQLIAQRAFGGDLLGLYVGAGLLGRAAILGSQPLLIVFFTQRSGAEKTGRHSLGLLGIYLLTLLSAIVFLIILSVPLGRALLGVHKMAMIDTMSSLVQRFAFVMLPLGLLQGLGYFFLASRRLAESYTFGILSLLYAGLLLLYGKSPYLMITLMFGGGSGAVLCLLLLFIVRWSRTQL